MRAGGRLLPRRPRLRISGLAVSSLRIPRLPVRSLTVRGLPIRRLPVGWLAVWHLRLWIASLRIPRLWITRLWVTGLRIARLRVGSRISRRTVASRWLRIRARLSVAWIRMSGWIDWHQRRSGRFGSRRIRFGWQIGRRRQQVAHRFARRSGCGCRFGNGLSRWLFSSSLFFVCTLGRFGQCSERDERLRRTGLEPLIVRRPLLGIGQDRFDLLENVEEPRPQSCLRSGLARAHLGNRFVTSGGDLIRLRFEVAQANQLIKAQRLGRQRVLQPNLKRIERSIHFRSSPAGRERPIPGSS